MVSSQLYCLKSICSLMMMNPYIENLLLTAINYYLLKIDQAVLK